MGFTYLAGHRLVGPLSAWYVGAPKEELHAIREHPALRGTRQGTQGRAGQAHHAGGHRRVQGPAPGRVGRLRGGPTDRLVRGWRSRATRQEVTPIFEKLGTGVLFTDRKRTRLKPSPVSESQI